MGRLYACTNSGPNPHPFSGRGTPAVTAVKEALSGCGKRQQAPLLSAYAFCHALNASRAADVMHPDSRASQPPLQCMQLEWCRLRVYQSSVCGTGGVVASTGIAPAC